MRPNFVHSESCPVRWSKIETTYQVDICRYCQIIEFQIRKAKGKLKSKAKRLRRDDSPNKFERV